MSFLRLVWICSYTLHITQDNICFLKSILVVISLFLENKHSRQILVTIAYLDILQFAYEMLMRSSCFRMRNLRAEKYQFVSVQ